MAATVGNEQTQVTRPVAFGGNGDLGGEIAGGEVDRPPGPAAVKRLLIDALKGLERPIGRVEPLAQWRLMLMAVAAANEL